RWIGLHGPQMRSSWIQNDDAATTVISATQIQPTVRWGSVPLGAASCTAPSANAAMAAKACSWMAGAASSSGASDTGFLQLCPGCGAARSSADQFTQSAQA